MYTVHKRMMRLDSPHPLPQSDKFSSINTVPLCSDYSTTYFFARIPACIYETHKISTIRKPQFFKSLTDSEIGIGK